MMNDSRTTLTPVLAGLWGFTLAVSMVCVNAHAAETMVPVTFSGGHEYGKNDYGRPVVLIAAALEVKPDVFREAFSGVTPSRGGKPSDDLARKNKAALMKVLAPHGVTNERLNEVSNYYRFQPQRGQLWKTTPAQAHAVVEDGKIKQIVVTEPGSGYSTPPKATIQGMEKIELRVTLQLSKELTKNGAIRSIEIAAPETPPGK